MFIILKTELRISTTVKHVYKIELLKLKPKNDKIIQIDQMEKFLIFVIIENA